MLTVFVLAAFSLVACSGDGRPFEEAVEIQQRQLVSMRILPPERTQDAFFAVGQLVDFRIEATNSNGGTESISGEDRDWRISDSSVANIDRNGRLIGLRASEEPILIDVIIGGVQSTSYSLSISEATLQNVSSINAVPTVQSPEPSSDTLDPCLPMEYFAIGNFGDSLRPLLQVEWSVSNPLAVDAAPVNGEPGVYRVNGTLPGPFSSGSGLAGRWFARHGCYWQLYGWRGKGAGYSRDRPDYGCHVNNESRTRRDHRERFLADIQRQ